MSEPVSPPLALEQINIVVRDMQRSLAFHRLLGVSIEDGTTSNGVRVEFDSVAFAGRRRLRRAPDRSAMPREGAFRLFNIRPRERTVSDPFEPRRRSCIRSTKSREEEAAVGQAATGALGGGVTSANGRVAARCGGGRPANPCRPYGTQPGNAAACFTQIAICASSKSSSWMSM
jgi:hypothetical protein